MENAAVTLDRLPPDLREIRENSILRLLVYAWAAVLAAVAVVAWLHASALGLI